MIVRPPHMNAYEFVVLAALRAQQLLSGCVPRLPGEHSAAMMAQMEVASGCVASATGAETAMEAGTTPTPDEAEPQPASL